jgi:hypothetical protein
MTPRKRLVALGFLAGVVAISSAAVALAAGGGTATTGTTIKLLEDETRGTTVKAGHHTGPAAGDESVASRTLRTMQKKPVGQLNFDCVNTKGGVDWISICTGVYTLPGGTLVGTLVQRGPLNGSSRLHIAVTGGTGRYEGARGSVLSLGSGTGLASDTIHLRP